MTRVLLICGSQRASSLNARLLAALAAVLPSDVDAETLLPVEVDHVVPVSVVPLLGELRVVVQPRVDRGIRDPRPKGDLPLVEPRPSEDAQLGS